MLTSTTERSAVLRNLLEYPYMETWGVRIRILDRSSETGRCSVFETFSRRPRQIRESHAG